MAKLKYILNLSLASDDFTGGFTLSVADSGKTANWISDETDAELRFTGKNLSAGDDDVFDGGTINGMRLVNPENQTILDITGLHVNAVTLGAAFEDNGIYYALAVATNGDDTVTGSKKDDYLNSGAGDDVLTGKGGSDTFVFQSMVGFRSNAKVSPQHDVITDFQAKGQDADLLIAQQEYLGFKPIHDGEDVRLKFEGGSTLVLEDVTKSEFQYWLVHNN